MTSPITPHTSQSFSARERSVRIDINGGYFVTIVTNNTGFLVYRDLPPPKWVPVTSSVSGYLTASLKHCRDFTTYYCYRTCHTCSPIVIHGCTRHSVVTEWSLPGIMLLYITQNTELYITECFERIYIVMQPVIMAFCCSSRKGCLRHACCALCPNLDTYKYPEFLWKTLMERLLFIHIGNKHTE
jgi:hypothetical protein